MFVCILLFITLADNYILCLITLIWYVFLYRYVLNFLFFSTRMACPVSGMLRLIRCYTYTLCLALVACYINPNCRSIWRNWLYLLLLLLLHLRHTTTRNHMHGKYKVWWPYFILVVTVVVIHTSNCNCHRWCCRTMLRYVLLPAKRMSRCQLQLLLLVWHPKWVWLVCDVWLLM